MEYDKIPNFTKPISKKVTPKKNFKVGQKVRIINSIYGGDMMNNKIVKITIIDQNPFGGYSYVYCNTLSNDYAGAGLFFTSDELEAIDEV